MDESAAWSGLPVVVMNRLIVRGDVVQRLLARPVISAQELNGQLELIIDWQATRRLSQGGMPREHVPQQCDPLRSVPLRQYRKALPDVEGLDRGRYRTTLDADSNPTIQLFDAAGNVIWSAP
jgi:hypothetical protein